MGFHGPSFTTERRTINRGELASATDFVSIHAKKSLRLKIGQNECFVALRWPPFLLFI